jgi:hypothetical protein
MLLLRETVGAQRDLDLGDSPWKIRAVFDTSGRPRIDMRMYYPSGAALTQYQILKVKYVVSSSGNPQVATVATSAGNNPIDLVCVAQNATVSGTWDWFAVQGYTSALVTSGGPVAAGDSLKITTATSSTALIQDQSGGGLTVNTVAYADAAGPASGAAAATRCYLLGERAALG